MLICSARPTFKEQKKNLAKRRHLSDDDIYVEFFIFEMILNI